MSTKFKVGDHVVVVDDSSYIRAQKVLTGTIIEVFDHNILPIHIEYDSSNETFRVGMKNSYEEKDLEFSKIHKSPLYVALK